MTNPAPIIKWHKFDQELPPIEKPLIFFALDTMQFGRFNYSEDADDHYYWIYEDEDWEFANNPEPEYWAYAPLPPNHLDNKE